jgi:RNA polymerase sigma factor (sigma-70 family)
VIDLDDIDRALLRALSADATESAGALGRRFGLSQPAAWRRVRRLEEAGILAGRRVTVDRAALGFGVTVFLGVKLATKGRVSLEDFELHDRPDHFMDWCAATNSDPLAALERKVLQRTLLIAISDLSEREDQVMTEYYVSGLTMKQIGDKLAVSEGRISQIHTQAIAKLRAAVLAAEASPSMLTPRLRTS